MKVINLFGAPCTGKSTTASGLFYQCKVAGKKCELVSEYAKQLSFDERYNTLADQVYILAKQNHKLEMLRGKVDFAITDSPLPLGILYQKPEYYSHYEPLLLEIFNSYDNINFLLTSSKGLGYQQYGRNQTEEEAKQIQDDLIKLLLRTKIPFEIIDMDPEDTDGNLEKILTIVESLGY